MKVFKLEFSVYNRILWKRKYYKIHAETIDQIKSSVEDIIIKNHSEIDRAYIETKWDFIKKNIIEEKLEFPLIHEH